MTKTIRNTAKNLVFHLSSENRGAFSGAHHLSVTITELGDLIESLRKSEMIPAKLSDYLGPKPPGHGTFTLSFDDAHPSVLELAAPVLEELAVPATVFVPTDYVGETDRVMDWGQIKALASKPGWTLGSHAATHERMSWRLHEEDEATHYERLLESLRRSRQAISERLNMSGRGCKNPVELMAYPFGEAPLLARRAAAAAGYRAAFTVDISTENWDGDMMAIPRLDGVAEVRAQMRTDEVGRDPVGISIIVPACDRVEILREVVRRLADQSYPEERFEVIIVDDGSKADLPQLLAPWLGERMRVVELTGSDGTFRAGQARQVGVEAARFEVLAFLDADVAVDQDFLWHLAYCHELDDKALVLGYLSGYNLHDLGKVHHLSEIKSAERLTGDVMPLILDRGREPTLRACLDDVQALDEPWRLAYTGNLSVRRELLEGVGGFGREFSGWGFEDVDLGVRLHKAGCRWFFSRWALGYHIADESECSEMRAPRNPFRDPNPRRSCFSGALKNLETLEQYHPEHRGVASFCARVGADIEEICDPPEVVGVEVGAPEAFDWPFTRRLHARQPGGLPLDEICERLAYAEKLGARSLYLLGGDVMLHPELSRILDAAKSRGARDITLETTALMVAHSGRASSLRAAGLSAAVIEVLAGGDHPLQEPAVIEGVSALGQAGIRVGAKIVVGEKDRSAFENAKRWVINTLKIPLYSVIILDKYDRSSETWVRESVGADVDVELYSQ